MASLALGGSILSNSILIGFVTTLEAVVVHGIFQCNALLAIFFMLCCSMTVRSAAFLSIGQVFVIFHIMMTFLTANRIRMFLVTKRNELR